MNASTLPTSFQTEAKKENPRHSSAAHKVAAAFLLGACVLTATDALSPAMALPSFARQTGQPCGTCHTDFPALTPYGRRFKLLGYTTGAAHTGQRHSGSFERTSRPWMTTPDLELMRRTYGPMPAA